LGSVFDPSTLELKTKKQRSLKTKTKIFPAKLGRKLSKTSGIGQIGYINMVGFILGIFGSFLLKLCVMESKTASKSPPGSWRAYFFRLAGLKDQAVGRRVWASYIDASCFVHCFGNGQTLCAGT
jgi:hypothetical protein